jgi:hypothetical protein
VLMSDTTREDPPLGPSLPLHKFPLQVHVLLVVPPISTLSHPMSVPVPQYLPTTRIHVYIIESKCFTSGLLCGSKPVYFSYLPVVTPPAVIFIVAHVSEVQSTSLVELVVSSHELQL